MADRYKSSAVVVSIPHSGEDIPTEVGQDMAKGVLLPGVDWYLPELYDFLPKMGIDTIVNNISRHVIDLNRGELTGIGNPNQCLVYTKNTMGRDIYVRRPDRREMSRRINTYYRPYHDALDKALAEKRERYGKAWLFDLHSFSLGSDADIILGNLDGRTMEQRHLDAIADIFEENGFKTAKNTPFKGGYIIKHHGRTANAVQIELNYTSYIDVRRFGNEERPAVDEELWQDCRRRLEKSFKDIIEYIMNENRL